MIYLVVDINGDALLGVYTDEGKAQLAADNTPAECRIFPVLVAPLMFSDVGLKT